MKKTTKLFFLLVAIASSIHFAKSVESTYCNTTVTHFNIAAETASGVKLTISKINATSMYVQIESATADPVDLLLVNGGSGATISEPDVTVAGKIKRTLTWTTAPANVSIELLWSKVTMGGNWMINTFVVPFDATCTGGTSDTTLPVMGSASVVGSPTFNSVNLLLAATDNVTSPVVSYIANDATNGITNIAITANATGNATVTGLNGSTTYNLVIKAKDAAGNISANSTTVTFTTTAAPALSTINFETVGQNWSWTVFQNGPAGSDVATNLVVPFANPSATGINTSASCAKFIENPTAQPWGGFFSESIGTFTFNASNCIVKVMVYKDKISPFGVKFEGQGGNPAFEVLVPNTKINEWETLTFNFTNKIGQTVKKLVFLPDFLIPRVTGGTTYIDNVSFSNGLTGIKSVSAEIEAIKCYPNPAINSVNVSAKSQISQVIIRNLLGQNIKSIMVNEYEKTIDLTDVSAGNYFVTVKLANGELSTQKIVKL